MSNEELEMTAITHTTEDFFALYKQLSNDEKNTIFSLLELLLRQKKENNLDKSKDWESFIKAAQENTEELPRIKPEKSKEITVFDDWIE